MDIVMKTKKKKPIASQKSAAYGVMWVHLNRCELNFSITCINRGGLLFHLNDYVNDYVKEEKSWHM